MSAFAIGNQRVGPGEPCYVIAEAGVNHNGKLDLALKLVDVAAAAGADAVKFQTFVADRVARPDARKAAYQERQTGANQSQLDMIRALELSFEAFREVAAHCKRQGIQFLSTPFDHESADFLATLGVPAFKVPSGEVTNHLYLAHVARKSRPLVVSTGMASLSEVAEALDVVRRAGAPPVALLQCVSNYPAAPETANLRAMRTLEAAFGVPVGYSDHTLGTEVALAAVAMGACVVEKHFTLDRTLAGPDHAASLEPDELRNLVSGIRVVESALGDGRKVHTPTEEGTRQVARRSLVVSRDVLAGAILGERDLAALRPADGIGADLVRHVVGRRLRRALAKGTPLTWEDLA